MRPTPLAFERFAQFLAVNHSGLPCSGDVVYNHLQNLPVIPVASTGGAFGTRQQAPMDPVPNDRQKTPATTTEAVSEERVVETRAQRLARIRREIQAGVYETPDKLEAAIERMLGVLVE